ncbi:MAG TPA: molybdenum cofactor biosynthesis protein MoaE [Myxococcota bacterium]|jgi:molybdopterin synthase catalytic subunit|nr:molybdenum cofactor biosynthesis protein MoaE [Myxococcota bacterium]
MPIRVRLFGAAREAVGSREIELALAPGARVADVKAALRAHPALAALCARAAVSVNREVAADDVRLAADDELALLPPVSGGSGRCTLSETPLDVGAVVARVAGPDAGGIVTFVGAVRDHARGRSVEKLEYEAYPEMAEREMDKIAAEAAERFAGARVAIAHRTGLLAVGELAVVVAAAAPHRAEAFAACRYAIDELKLRVPIWKKEFASDGAFWVDDRP